MANPDSIDRLIARLADGESLTADRLLLEADADPLAQRILRLGRMLEGVRAVAAAPELDTPEPQDGRPGEVLGTWRLLHPLGAGGMGEVWLAERCDGQVEQRVAIKRVRGARRLLARRLRRERRILAGLSHPNIARFIDAGVDASGVPYLVMEFIDGLPIDRWCAQRASGLHERLRLMIAICDAVDHANRQMVVHRDLKPDNVLVGDDGAPKLLDFGIAKLLETTQSARTLTAIDALTPAYATPEQLAGDEVSTATDVYALGLMLYELLCGELPHGRPQLSMAQLAAVLERGYLEPASRVLAARTRRLVEDAPWPIASREIRADLDAIVAKALRLEPLARYRTAGDLADDLRCYLDGRVVRAHGGSRAYRARKFLRRHRLGTAAAASATLALLGGLGIALWQAGIARESARRADAEAASSERIATFALNMVREQYAHGRWTTERRSPQAMLASSIAKARAELGDDDQARATMLSKLGELQSVVDSPDQAEPAVAEALAIRRRLHGDAHHETAVSIMALATVKSQQGQLAEAESLLREALFVFAGSDTPRYVVMTGVRLADVLRRTGRIAEALEQLSVAQTLAAEAYGADHPNAIELGVNRSMLLAQLERLDEAEAEVRGAIEAYERHLGRDFPRLSSALSQLGALLAQRGRYREARAAYERAVDIGRRQIGSADHYVIRTIVHHAQLLRTIGELEAAERELDGIDAGKLEDRPADRSLLLRTRGQLLGDRGARAEALAALHSARDLLRGLEGTTEAVVAVELAIADTLIALQRWDEAAGVLKAARATGDPAALPLGSRTELARLEARVAARAGRVDEALAVLARTIETLSAVTGSDTVVVARLELERAEILAGTPGRVEEAARSRAASESRLAALGVSPAWVRRPAPNRTAQN